MTTFSTWRQRRRFATASLAFASSLLLATSSGAAMAQNSYRQAEKSAVSVREYRAIHLRQDHGRCAPANGAQIMGGFAGPDDWLDSVTGEVCAR